MRKYTGKSVCRGIAAGPVHVWRKQEQKVQKNSSSDIQTELERLERAVKHAQADLEKLYDKALQEVGAESAAIFEVHQMMLEDEDYQDAIAKMIRTEHVSAEYAVQKTGIAFSALFSEMEDAYMQARASDVRDISERLVQELTRSESRTAELQEPCILIAEDLTPGETMQMDRSKLLAFVTVHGSSNSHTAILARMMNIPALIGVPLDLEEISDGVTAVVDTLEQTDAAETEGTLRMKETDGVLLLHPTDEVLWKSQNRIREEQEHRIRLQELRGKESVTRDGRKINLYANIGSVNDLEEVRKQDAEGIGLFRSEFLYLDRKELPTEEEQLEVYRKVLQRMEGQKVIVRTLDLGADKQADCLPLAQEENPALGYRAIRICLTRPELFRTQLRALFRAAVYGNLSIMYPMITSVWELQQIQEMVCQVQQELEREQIPYRVPEQGIMVETPAAALISDELAPLTDFFSIGTNDLSQYTLAVDRQNARLDAFYDPHHRAILRLIEFTVKNAHAHGIWAGICGELASDLTLTETFLRMGVDELSVAPGMVLPLREKVRSIAVVR